MSRYPGGRFDGDRRSRSPRDRSPYGDRVDRGPQYPDADRRRPPPDSRGNPPGFPPSRDSFRDSLSGIQPPRGPKALLDPPSGPRGGGFAGDFRGRGRGGGRGRQWRDDSRDGGRDREDYRDRPHFRDERSRERERVHDRERERDWPRDQRDRVDFPRARRPSPPPLRARSPLPSRDFRDVRDPPLGVDAERARRGSRDGPLSAGSSNSDPMFAPSPFRGSFRGAGRGVGRGRGDWDQRGGRDRGNFYDDRDRYPRSRSQESRWGREPDDRDRRDSRYPDMARDLRDDREIRERENRERELIRPKPDRVSHEPPSAKDVSPPPLAPSAPAFGSVPSRQSTSTDIQSLTGKPPPTGPRALTEERPVSAGHGVGNERPPPTGPSKPALSDGGPPIPLGPRAQQKQQRSSKQWINPSLTAKKAQVESPKTARSQNFPSQPARPSSYSAHTDYRDFDKRPRSPGARSDSHALAAERYGPHVATGANEIMIKSERGSQSARTSVDRETRTAPNSADLKMGGMDTEQPPREQEARASEQTTTPIVPKPGDIQAHEPKEQAPSSESAKKPTILAAPSCRVQLPPRETSPLASDESSESDDDEDMDVYFEGEISKTEAELKKLKDAVDKVPVDIVKRYATAVHEAMLVVLNERIGLADVVGPIPDSFTFPRPKPGTEVADKEMPDTEPQEQGDQRNVVAPREPSAIPTVEADDSAVHPPEPQPKVEETDTGGLGLPPAPALSEMKPLSEDVDMQHVAAPQPITAPVLINAPPAAADGPAFFPHPFGRPETERSSVSLDEGSEDRTEDDASIYGSIEVVREFSATPPTEDLPIYNIKPWFQSRRVRKLGDEPTEFGEFLYQHLKGQTVTAHLAQSEERNSYAMKYDSYLRFTLSDDPAAVKSRDYFSSSGVQPGTTGKAASSDSKPEGGRRGAGRFSTELDLEAAIKESIREHQERKEREERAQKEKYRTEKEAVIPEMFWTDEEKERASFYDTAGLQPLEKLVATWQVVPGHVNFTQEEADRFEKAYLETPKQWGRISKEVGNRDPGTCILYYYAKKRDLNLKDKLKKQPRRRKKGRGKQRSSALVSELGNTENETEDAAGQETGENGERRRPPRRAAAPVWGNDATPNADSDGATPAPTPGRRRAGTTADGKNDGSAEKAEGKRGGGRKPRQPKVDKEPKGPKQLAQAPGGAPLAVPGKTGRSRANSKAQGPEWMSPQTPVDLAARIPLPFDVPHTGMQPPLVPVQQGPLASPDRAVPPIPSTISEVMAPPSLRPEPPPPPASVPTFEISQPAGPERIRTPQQASSYWSVSETTDFPGLLRSFGTDWVKIANHMQTKTATMVKNYYVRQTKEGGKPEWEQLAMEADAKGQRGEKRPAPPTPTQGPRKRYDVSSTGHRPLAAAEPEDAMLTKVESQQNQPFSRFQVPIAQAAPVSHPLVQPTPVAMTTPLTTTAAAPQAPTSGPAVTQTMSPHIHPLRPPGPAYPYPERETEAPAQTQQPVRISQKPVPSTSATTMPSSSEPPRPAQWATDPGQPFSLLSKEARGARDARERQRLELVQRESPRPVERAPLRMKQEPEPALHHPEAYPQFQPPPRGMSSRMETTPLGRQPEPARTAAPVPQSYAQPSHSQPMRSMHNEPVQAPQMPPANERPMQNMPRQPPVSMQEQYSAAPVSAPTAPPPPPQQQPAPAPARAPERKVNIMSLLNDDDPPPPKRVSEVSSVKRSSTPQPLVRQPTSAPLPPRREVETGYPYARGPAQAPQSAIPPLKPYQTQSPQPQHMRVPSTGITSMDPAAEAQRDYYARHSYPAQQHAVSAANSPQSQQTQYGQHGQHIQQHPQQHPQQAQVGYQGQQPYQPYQVSQPHAASPTPQYAPHPSMSGRREAPPSGREPWPPQQQPMHQHQHQQHIQQQQQQQQQQHHPHHQQHPSQSGWPSHQAPPKTSQPVPAPSAWGAQNGGIQTKPSVSSPLPQQQHHNTWPTSGPSQQQPHPFSLRESRGPSVYESQSPTVGMPTHPHHQHHNSLGGGRYGPGPPQDVVRRGEQQPPAPQQAGGSQPPYARYTNTPGPQQQQQQQQGRDPTRTYTPVTGGFDPRGPPPQAAQQQQAASQQQAQHASQAAAAQQHHQQQQQYVAQQHQEAAMREQQQQQQMREAQIREMQLRAGAVVGRDPADQGGPVGAGGGSGGAAGLLARQLRPGPEGGPPPGPGPGPGQGGMYDRGGGEGRRF
ncbi:uncharacterized protein B0H64DRAFT_364211 [Chaetomium fimeti]|uniref:SANT domain-containing protein n=1 Tax=Chaetomium fimeti TaxID=1854472 RepID=A0AAE0HBL4_9PEZI|nr:hypothetical protein B0H64DRAFT_364211 [Chaetomium fimeti]